MKLKVKCKLIYLTNGESVVVDKENYEYLNQFKWYPFKTQKWKYAIRTARVDGKDTTVFMHREIMGVNDSKVYVDHKDHNGLNNTKKNLRISDNRKNQYNVGKKTNSKQKYKNIRQLSKTRWQVRFRTPKGHRLELVVGNEKRAVELYNELALKYHGEYAYLQEYTED